MTSGARRGSRRSQAGPDSGSSLGNVFFAALVLGTCATNGAIASVVLQQGVVAGASPTEFAVLFDKDFNGDACNTEGKQCDGQ